jgi:hypothetical protein
MLYNVEARRQALLYDGRFDKLSHRQPTAPRTRERACALLAFVLGCIQWPGGLARLEEKRVSESETRRELELAGGMLSSAQAAELARMRREGIGDDWMWS